MLRRVDFPHPDGPITATYSPSFTLRVTLLSAVVSTSSVLKILVKSIVLIMTLIINSYLDFLRISFSFFPKVSYPETITFSPGFRPSSTS